MSYTITRTDAEIIAQIATDRAVEISDVERIETDQLISDARAIRFAAYALRTATPDAFGFVERPNRYGAGILAVGSPGQDRIPNLDDVPCEASDRVSVRDAELAWPVGREAVRRDWLMHTDADNHCWVSDPTGRTVVSKIERETERAWLIVDGQIQL